MKAKCGCESCDPTEELAQLAQLEAVTRENRALQDDLRMLQEMHAPIDTAQLRATNALLEVDRDNAVGEWKFWMESAKAKNDACGLLHGQLSEARATNARLTALVEVVQKHSTRQYPPPQFISQAEWQEIRDAALAARSSDASQDLACIREAIQWMEAYGNGTEMTSALPKIRGALRERFGGAR